jgi:uncharacterized protein (TIGR02284 family)
MRIINFVDIKKILGLFVFGIGLGLLLTFAVRAEIRNAVLQEYIWQISTSQNDTGKQLSLKDTIKELQALVQHEIDYSFILSQAISSIKDASLKGKLSSFKEDTEGHIRELSDMTRKLGGEPPAYSRDFKGLVMQGYTVIRGLTSDTGVMKALHTNNKIILNAYERAKNLSIPLNLVVDVKSVINRLYQDHEQTYEYLVGQIQ